MLWVQITKMTDASTTVKFSYFVNRMDFCCSRDLGTENCIAWIKAPIVIEIGFFETAAV